MRSILVLSRCIFKCAKSRKNKTRDVIIHASQMLTISEVVHHSVSMDRNEARVLSGDIGETGNT